MGEIHIEAGGLGETRHQPSPPNLPAGAKPQICPFFPVVFQNDEAFKQKKAWLIRCQGGSVRAFQGQHCTGAGIPGAHSLHELERAGDKTVTFPSTRARINAGKNMQRELDALEFLRHQSVVRQTTGNCWIKNPRNVLLAAAYMAIIKSEKFDNLSVEAAYDLAKAFYKSCILEPGNVLIESEVSKLPNGTRLKTQAQFELARMNGRLQR